MAKAFATKALKEMIFRKEMVGKMAKAFEANPVFRALFLSRGGSGEVGLLKS